MAVIDVLVIVDGAAVPEPLSARAERRVDVEGTAAPDFLVGELRGRIPRLVGVVGALPAGAEVAAAISRSGCKTVLFSDEAGSAPADVEVRRLNDPGAPMEAAAHLSDLIGHTPLLRLDHVARDLWCQLLAKLEFLNPGGSVKDRPARAMIEAAEEDGLLSGGGTIVEPTSGNTGLGLAMVAAERGYRCIFTMPDKIAAEKIQLLRAYGAEVVVCPTAVSPDHPESYLSVAERLAQTTPGAFEPNQYRNPANPRSHEQSTGPEIWQQTAGRITHLVASIGTGGTISGVARYLKQMNPAIEVVGADPEGSVYSGGGGRPYLVEGIGEDFWPETYDASVVDRVVAVSDRDSFLTARRVAREEGLLLGGSSGTAIFAALSVGAGLSPDDVVVVLLPDSGRSYLTKVYNDEWMADHGFLLAAGQTTGEVMRHKSGQLPPLVHVHPDETVRAAIALLEEFDVSQLPVVKAEPPLALAEVVGSVSDRLLLDEALGTPEVLDSPVSEVMEPPLPTVGRGETVETAAIRLEKSPAVLVLDGGHPVGILTRSDILTFLSRANSGARASGAS